MVKANNRTSTPIAISVRKYAVDIERLDRSIARKVRADRSDEAERKRLEDWSDELAELYREGKTLPPVQVYTWVGTSTNPGSLLLSDGESRTCGREKAGFATVDAEVRTYPSKKQAERAAREHAYVANGKHGLPRSMGDRRATVREALLDPDHATDSDNEIKDLCGVSRGLVKQLRLGLSSDGTIPKDSPAHAENRDYAKGGGPRPGYAYREDGSTIRTCPRRKGGDFATPGEPVEGCVGHEPPVNGCDNRDRCEYAADSPLPRPAAPPPSPPSPPSPRPYEPRPVEKLEPVEMPSDEEIVAKWAGECVYHLDGFRRSFGNLTAKSLGVEIVSAVAAELGIAVSTVATDQDRFTGQATQTEFACEPESALHRLMGEVVRRVRAAGRPAAA